MSFPLLILDPSSQPRVTLDTAMIDEFAEAMRAGDVFPALIAFGTPGDAWLADGWHRYHAAQKAEMTEIEVEYRAGGLTEAQWHAASANATHGLRRSTADKQRAVELALLAHPEVADREIARHCAVSHPMVISVREKLEANGRIDGEMSERVSVSVRGGKRVVRTQRLVAHPKPIPPESEPEPVAEAAVSETAPGGESPPSTSRTDVIRRAVEMFGEFVRYQRAHGINAIEFTDAIRNPQSAAPACREFSRFAGAISALVDRRAGGGHGRTDDDAGDAGDEVQHAAAGRPDAGGDPRRRGRRL